MRGLTLAQVQKLRRTPGATVALFLTDRCPVGCAHCSVSSRVDSPTITDWELFTEVVAGICAVPSLEVVAITGGEPFAERRGLVHAVRRLHDAGKAVVLFTSGYWAGAGVAPWISHVLESTGTVFLSTDSFHVSGRRAVDRERLGRAVRVVEAAGCHLILQILDEPGAVDEARALSDTAEMSIIPRLATGRGQLLFPPPPERALSTFGRCDLVNSPTVRYDGVVTACCNEAVITGSGPDGLRRTVTSGAGVGAALDELRRDPVLRVMGRLGPSGLRTVVADAARTVCDPCWTAHDRVAVDTRARTLLTMIGGVT